MATFKEKALVLVRLPLNLLQDFNLDHGGVGVFLDCANNLQRHKADQKKKKNMKYN